MSRFIIPLISGVLGIAGAGAAKTPEPAFSSVSPDPSLRPDAFLPFKLISSRYETRDTRRFLFSIGTPEKPFSWPIASCVLTKFVDSDGKEVVRPYTPISGTNTRKGYFEILVKRYPNGKMGNHLFHLKPGEELLVKGPFETLPYRPNMWSHVGMLAGGTGITPMYQVIEGILDNEKDNTKISLVYANKKQTDILLANELLQFRSTHKNRFSLYFTICDIPKQWLGGIGYISKSILSTYMPDPQEKNAKILVCGPPAMMKALCGVQKESLSGMLHEMGYTADQVFKF